VSALNEPLHGAAADKVRDQLADARATRALLEAVLEAIDIPLAALAEDDGTRADLLSIRASRAAIMIADALRWGVSEPGVEQLRGWTAETPVTYTPYKWRETNGGGQ
jgi:hypothetical protein